MSSGEVTKRAIDALQAGPSDVYLWDHGGREGPVKGFGAKITPRGVVSFVYQYRMGGRGTTARRLRIGGYGEMTPAQARSQARALAQQVLNGVDPLDAKREARREAVDLAFAPYVDRFVEGYLKSEWKASWQDGESALKRFAVPVLTTTPVSKIKRSDIAKVLSKADGRAATKRNLFATLRRLFNWAVSQGDIDDTPMRGFEAPPLPPSRDRVLEDDELGLVWRAASSLPYPFGPLFRLLIATGQRREEVAGLDWSELSKPNVLWTLPSARAKNDKAHLVPLNAVALAVVDELATLAGGDEWPTKGLVFTTNGKTPVSGHSRAKRCLDEKVTDFNGGEDLPAWRVHDLRRTVATGLQRLGVRFEVTEAVLNHVSGARSGVAGVYQRHDWKGEKREALEAWGRELQQLGPVKLAGRPHRDA